jgi:hypothetical protein
MDINYFVKSGTKPVDNLTTKDPRIIHVVPDLKSNIVDYIKKTLGIRPNSIYSIVSKPGTIKIAGKSFNSKTYTNQLKILIKQRKINVLVQTNMPNKIPKGKFVIVDHSVMSQAIGYVNELASSKQAIGYLFQNLKESMKQTQSDVGLDVKQSLLFPMNKYNNGMVDIINYLKVVPKVDLNSNFNVFDDICMASVALDERNVTIIPIMGYDTKGHVEIYKNNIGKLSTALKNLETLELKKVGAEKLEKLPTQNRKLKAIVGNIDKSAVKEVAKKGDDGFYKPSVEIDQKKLSLILRKHKIKDMTVANNIKNSIDDYLGEQKEKEDVDFSNKEYLEQLILKSVHFSLFQTDEIREEFLHDPALLIKKLSDVNSHSTTLNIPTVTHDQMIDPNRIVDLKTINNIRHEYELDDNIHSSIDELFKSLENKKSAPIKIVNIKRDYKDDNLNRFIEYTVKMKNMIGGDKTPYEVKMKIPSLVNNRYLKLNGSEYILLAQQYLVPLTKDKVNEARFQTHFQMTRVFLKNMKFNISQIDDIMNYIDTKYPELVKDKIKTKDGKFEKIEFQDGTIITPREETVFHRFDKSLVRKGSKFIVKKRDEESEISVSKNEFLFDELLLQIKKINSNDTLTTSKRSIPYILANIMSRKIPLVYFLWQQQGLIESLIKLGVDYEIGSVPSKDKEQRTRIVVNLDDDGKLFIYPENRTQEYIFNGLTQLPKNVTITTDSINNRTGLDTFLKDKFNTRTIERFNQATEKMIDPTTEKLLEFYEYPDNYVDVLTGPLLDKLLNDTPDHPADLKTLRVRQAEIFSNIIYDQLSIAHNNYVEKINTGNEDAKVRMDENYVINNLMGRHRNARNDGGSLIEFVKCGDFV